jgi:hypothetical protein
LVIEVYTSHCDLVYNGNFINVFITIEGHTLNKTHIEKVKATFHLKTNIVLPCDFVDVVCTLGCYLAIIRGYIRLMDASRIDLLDK